MSNPKIRKGYRKQRVKRPVEKGVEPGYDSKWEYELHTGILKEWKIHEDKIDYVVEHKYTPDFVRVIDGTTILLEAKGRFWDNAEFSKYIWIAKALPPNYELVFIFANPSAPMPQSKKRKDGTRRSHSDWADANGFRWYSEDSIPDDWIDSSARDIL